MKGSGDAGLDTREPMFYPRPQPALLTKDYQNAPALSSIRSPPRPLTRLREEAARPSHGLVAPRAFPGSDPGYFILSAAPSKVDTIACINPSLVM